MKRYEYTEFIRYSENFKKDNLDFYGKTSPLGEKETKEFFAKYADALKNEYGEDCLGKQAVEKEQIDAAMALLSKKETLSFTAYKKKHLSGYKCWQLYTDRATIEKNTIILKDDYSLPTAAAKCEFPEHLKKLTLSVYFDEEYRRPIPGGALITTPGKQIDLRAGITDSVRLFFAEDGKLIVRENKTRDVYHYSDTVLCEYPFDKSFDIEFELGENNYTIFSLGKSLTLPYLLGQKPDTLFLSGGLQPTSEWRVEIATALNEDGKSVELFETEAKEYPMEKIGEVTLPYVIGTEKNKDKELILRTSFIAEEGLSYALRLEALDPLGEVYLNGNLVSTVKDFSQTFIYLDKFVSKGKNELELRIMPRAPELLYVWHRHKDPYNGWFSLSADLISGKKIVSDRPVIKLEGDMVPKTVKAIWNTGLSEDLIYKAYIRKSFPAKNDFVEIASGNAENGNLCFTFPCNYDLWSVDSPVLYEIRIDLIENGSTVYSDSVETGFRIVKQKNGAIYINGEKTVL
ncbi:MAG: hypothetical protein J6Q67_03810, partial [Clostridia bacterium]|nr:hypothetical protein [Clostridia bacterium]